MLSGLLQQATIMMGESEGSNQLAYSTVPQSELSLDRKREKEDGGEQEKQKKKRRSKGGQQRSKRGREGNRERTKDWEETKGIKETGVGKRG